MRATDEIIVSRSGKRDVEIDVYCNLSFICKQCNEQQIAEDLPIRGMIVNFLKTTGGSGISNVCGNALFDVHGKVMLNRRRERTSRPKARCGHRYSSPVLTFL